MEDHLADRLERLAFLIILCVYLGLTYPYFRMIGSGLLDDAFIHLRYADNFVAGHGFVYNVGEAVEGYTSFLWVLILGIAGKLGLNMLATSQGLGVVLGVISLLATWRACRHMLRQARPVA